ncbi:MAG TPA: Gfo/Idh/MocA family oxidoreductase, partial [Urbifossiella sp.]|nr:Gfo/Idh/MocA family oxidoreductase [Urbifossiella sp.]
MPRRSPSRRAFLAAAAGTLAAPMFVRARGANDRLNVAVIGCGGRGAANLAGVAAENVVALCDVNRAAIGAAATRFPRAAHFADFRRLFDEKAREFDAVVVSTCEHTHAHATLRALRAGKHVYCEKPLTHNVWEARLIRTEAAKTRLATQMGTQIHAGDNYRRVVELVRAGAVGPVREVHVWVGRAWGLQSAEDAKKNGDIVHVTDRPTEDVRPPAELDWDLWLGPAPARPFSPVYVPGPKWYRWWAFGNGTMSDLGSHWNDLPFWALDLKAPTSVEASGPLPPHAEIAPASMQATYRFPARGQQPAVAMTWYQGANKPPAWAERRIPQWPSGVLFVGDRGMLLSDYGKHVLLPEDRFAGF